MIFIRFGSMPSTQPYMNPFLGMSRTFGADLRMYVKYVKYDVIRRNLLISSCLLSPVSFALSL